MPEVPRHVTLERQLGLLDATGIGVGAIIGAGIFVVLGVAAGVAGAAVLVGILLAAVAATANALSSAQLAATYPVAGGTYEYGYRVIGPATGFAAGWMFLVGKIAAAGTVAIGLSGYAANLFPGLPPRPLAAGAVVAFTALNYVGIRRSSRVNLAVVAVSVGSLMALTVAGLREVQTSSFTPFAPTGWRGVLEAAALMFFAYTGYARIATLGEEVRQPRVTIPRAIVLTIAVTVVLYAGVAYVAVGTVGAAALAASDAPLELAAARVGPTWLVGVVSVGAFAAMLGVMLSQLLGLSRMAFAMARRGDLPAGLSAVHERFRVPHRAVVLVGAIAAVVAVTGTLRGVAAAAAFTILVYYGIANVSALRMPREAKIVPDIVPAVGVIACLSLALALPLKTITVGLSVLVGGLGLRALVRGRETAN